jgi:hypothetical protein
VRWVLETPIRGKNVKLPFAWSKHGIPIRGNNVKEPFMWSVNEIPIRMNYV